LKQKPLLRDLVVAVMMVMMMVVHHDYDLGLRRDWNREADGENESNQYLLHV
jgi:hypothetical protein